jgi:hypothetical protein
VKAEDKVALAAMLAKVMSVYSKQITTGFVDVFFDALAGYDIESVRRGLNAHVQNPDSGQFAPKPADVVRLIDGTSQDQGMLAWSRVDKTVRRVGPYQSVVFDDPIVHRVLDDMGGWVKLCTANSEEDYKFQGLEFARRYRAFVIAGGVGDDYPKHLIGISEAESGGRFKAPDPLLIGDRKACLAVLQKGAGGRLAITRAGKSVGELISESKRLGQTKKGAAHET